MKQRVLNMFFALLGAAMMLLLINDDVCAQVITYPAQGGVVKIVAGLKIQLDNPPAGAVLWSPDSGKTWQSVASILGTATSVGWSPFISGSIDSNCFVAYATENTGTPVTFDTSEKDGPIVLWQNRGTKLAVTNPNSTDSVLHQDSTIWIKFSAPVYNVYAPDTVNVYITYRGNNLPPNFKRTDTLLKGFEVSDLRNGGSDSVAWKVPRTPTTVQAFVQTSDFQVQGASVPLAIQGATISILSPTGGDSLALGGTDTIRWSLSDSVSNDTVTIYYSPGGAPFTTIATRVPSWKGYYVWNIPANTTPAPNGEIVISADAGFINQRSNAFWLGQRSNTGVAAPAGTIPSVSLEQNYPNPFSAGDNSITNIPFSLSSAQNVSLRVFDVLGRVVFQSPSQFFDAGAHTMLFNASQFQPGAYWYDMLAGTRSIFGARLMMLYVK